jgi:hypothetical protein
MTTEEVETLADSYGLLGIESESGELPMAYELMQNYPNPFNPITNIKFQVPKAGHVKIFVYNILGQRVATLLDKEMKVGKHLVTFNATRFATGIYFYRIQTDGFMQTKKMMLLK